MAEALRTADYAQQDEGYAITMTFARKTTAELNAMQTAKQIGIGQLYFDTTASGFRLGVDPSTYSGVIMNNSGAVVITGGTINGTSIGATTRAAGSFTALSLNSQDSSGTPGNFTANTPMGRGAFAAAASAVTVTNSNVSANSIVQVQVMGSDTTLTTARVTSVGVGSFVVTGNAAATATTVFNFTVFNV